MVLVRKPRDMVSASRRASALGVRGSAKTGGKVPIALNHVNAVNIIEKERTLMTVFSFPSVQARCRNPLSKLGDAAGEHGNDERDPHQNIQPQTDPGQP